MDVINVETNVKNIFIHLLTKIFTYTAILQDTSFLLLKGDTIG
jgi:hypothetical protein